MITFKENLQIASFYLTEQPPKSNFKLNVRLNFCETPKMSKTDIELVIKKQKFFLFIFIFSFKKSKKTDPPGKGFKIILNFFFFRLRVKVKIFWSSAPSSKATFPHEILETIFDNLPTV